MKILVLGSRIPWPLHDGGAIATYRMIKGLAEAGAAITYFSYNTRKHFQSPDSIQEHFPFCKIIPFELDATPTAKGALLALLQGKNYNISRFESQKAAAQVAELCANEKFDCIHVEGLFAFPLIAALKENRIPIILRGHNVEYEIWSRLAVTTANPLKKGYLQRLARGLKAYETAAVKQCDYVVAISEPDAAEFRHMHPKANVIVVPGGIEVQAQEESVSVQEFSLCHIGSMEWRPNQEAVQWFIDSIWPRVLQEYPKATFHIAGKGLSKDDARFVANGVFNHGEVADAAVFMQQHAALVVPLHSGSGLRMKTVEAMALGTMVITSSVGLQGLEARPNTHLLLANTQEEWIHAITLVFLHPDRRKELAAVGKNWALSHFGYQNLAKDLLQQYQQWIAIQSK